VNQSDIYAVARHAGLSDSKARIASAIAMAESGGNPRAHNATPPDDSYGLWQINMLGSLGPARRALYQLSSNDALYDPATNARVMSAISKQGGNFAPWTTYTSGKYKAYMSTTLADILPGGTALADAASNVRSAIGDVAGFPAAVVDTVAKAGDALTRTTRWVSNQKNWLRVGYVIGGGALALAAIRVIAGGTVASLVPGAKTARSIAKGT
jgi:hypothetical protein